ncbi:MAG: cell wall protein [Micromonosporaceae bacterium]|nr:cell wall protein [Micromonosporaceae bacterium]
MDRRQMLTTAVLGSAAGIVGATALGSVGPEAAFAAESEAAAEPGAPDPNYVDGIVTSIDGTQLLVDRGEGVIDRVLITQGTSIWKLRTASFDAIEVGDDVAARGVRMPDGALAADAVWMNIVNFFAHVTSINRGAIHLEHNGAKIVGHVIKGTTVASYNSTPAVSDLSPLKVGDHVQVLGAQRPGSSHVEIATIFATV